jgi:hypothetical protein
MTKQEQPSMRDRVREFLTLIAIVVGIVLAIIVWQAVSQLSPDALALGGGVLIGLGLLVLFLVAGVGVFYLAVRWREAQPRQQQTQPNQPMVIVAGGQPWPMQQPGSYSQQQALPTVQTERGYEVIGTD